MDKVIIYSSNFKTEEPHLFYLFVIPAVLKVPWRRDKKLSERIFLIKYQTYIAVGSFVIQWRRLNFAQGKHVKVIYFDEISDNDGCTNSNTVLFSQLFESFQTESFIRTPILVISTENPAGPRNRNIWNSENFEINDEWMNEWTLSAFEHTTH